MDKLNPVSKMHALELSTSLPELWAEHPDGFTTKDIAGELCCSVNQATAAAHALADMGKAKVEMRRDAKHNCRMRIVPLDYQSERWDLTFKQQAVVDFLMAGADKNDIVESSHRRISRGALAKDNASAAFHIEALEKKGYLRVLRTGDSKTPSLFMVFPFGDGEDVEDWIVDLPESQQMALDEMPDPPGECWTKVIDRMPRNAGGMSRNFRQSIGPLVRDDYAIEVAHPWTPERSGYRLFHISPVGAKARKANAGGSYSELPGIGRRWAGALKGGWDR